MQNQINKDLIIKIIAIIVTIIVISNLILFVTKRISNFVFWMVIIVSAFIAYKGIDYLKKL